MKRTISLVIASAAVAMALVSCTKENISNKEVEKGINADGTRTLTVSFAANPTKTTLGENGITPEWAEGDQIFLADGTATETYTVTAGQAGHNTVTITTTLQGTISAVYPADAAIEEGNIITGVKVEAVQDGTFGSANICMAKEEPEGVLSFENKTAVFAVAVPDGTTKLTVTSLGKIDSETGQRGTDATDTVAINTTKTGSAANVIIVEKEDKSAFEKDSVYVAVAVDPDNGVLLADLNFDIQYKDSESKVHYAQGGVSPKYIKSKGKDPMIYKAAAGTIYSLPGEALHPYVNVNGNKWATCNIGATQPSEPGRYFQFADTIGYTAADLDKTFDYDMSGGQAPGMVFPMSIFHSYGAPYTDALGGSTKYYTEGAKLQLIDDAASYWWGGAWRIPYLSDFKDTWPDPDDFTVATDDDGRKYTSKDGVFFYWHEYIIGNADDITNPSGKFVHNAGYLFRLAETNDAGAAKKAYVIRVDFDEKIDDKTTGYAIETEIRAAGIPVRPFSN